MSLPLVDLDITLIANYLGIATQDLGELFVQNPNPHGFNCGSWHADLQSHFWGISSPQPWFDISAFKNFDLYWRTYVIGQIEIGSDIGLYNPGFLGFNINVIKALTQAPAFQTVPHVFDIWMNRYNIDWNPANGAVLIAQDFTIYEDGRQKIDINPASPPDGLGPLPYNHPIYFSFRHKSSPARRWDSRWWQVQNLDDLGSIYKDNDGNYDGWTITININEPI